MLISALPKPRVHRITPFIDATIDALGVMADVAVKAGAITLHEDFGAPYDLTGRIGAAGEVVGAVMLSFPRVTAEQVTMRFPPRRCSVVPDDVFDVVGELTSIVAGASKRELAHHGLRYAIGLPTVVVGRGRPLVRPRHAPTVCVHFTSDAGEFALAVCLRRVAEGDGAAPVLTEV